MRSAWPPAHSHSCGFSVLFDALLLEALRALSRDVIASSSIKSSMCFPAGRIASENKSCAFICNAFASLAIMSTVGEGLILPFLLASTPCLDRSRATTYGCEMLARWASCLVVSPSWWRRSESNCAKRTGSKVEARRRECMILSLTG